MKTNGDNLDATLDRYVGKASAPPAGQVESSVDAVWERLRPEADRASVPAREIAPGRSYFTLAAAVLIGTVAIGIYAAQRSGLFQRQASHLVSPAIESQAASVSPSPAPEPVSAAEGVAIIEPKAPPLIRATAFEVASIKQSTPTTTGSGPWSASNGRFRAERASVRSLIGWAYGVLPVQVKGSPDWIEHERYDFDASAANPSVEPERIRTMLQTLLTERFKLRVRRESELAQVDIPPDLIAAVQEQLGFDLQAPKRLVEFVVIDRIERPSDN